MIEIVHSGWLSLVVDNGRFGHAGIGVPWSSALDSLAYGTLNFMLGNDPGAPAIEAMGNEFALRFHEETTCAICGARVSAQLDGEEIDSWASFKVGRGSLLRVSRVLEGFRYYVGVSGTFDLPRVIGSFSTNLECRFGGLRGRPLIRGDVLGVKATRSVEEKSVPAEYIPTLRPPHAIRWVDGPEIDYFTQVSIKKLCTKNEDVCYAVAVNSNRTGVRVEGEPLHFKKDIPRSIVSEGLLPGTIQVPGDGTPIIVLYERTNGGYARIGVVARADMDLLAHLKPKDRILFRRITRDEALDLGRKRNERISALHHILGG
jgi:antagonist of KipI